MGRLPLELLLKSLQIAGVHIGDRPVIEIGIRPMQKLKALARDCPGSFARIWFCRPNKQVNEMFAPLINQCRRGPVTEVIETATYQRKAFAGQIDHRRGESELRVQPWLDRVLIGRSDIGKVVCHERTHMTVDELRRKKLIGAVAL